MTKFILSLFFSLVVSAAATAQEHKHEEHKEEKKGPASKAKDPAKAESMKCCEEMDKMGEMKQAAPTKGDMKAKMEKMKEMKEKMSEKMKGMDGMKKKDTKGDAKTSEPDKDTHQH